ncbi:hypothetical protein Cni_G23696 [Canna indica]|uniref:LTI65/LTI78 PGEED repeat domain-containing protein n=1 Tax=Canna indica TaxID=4628 RepID=A0AAQ3KUV7_9LILI|nr:hypothetical protein Cni_G23696 [Canna indica]
MLLLPVLEAFTCLHSTGSKKRKTSNNGSSRSKHSRSRMRAGETASSSQQSTSTQRFEIDSKIHNLFRCFRSIYWFVIPLMQLYTIQVVSAPTARWSAPATPTAGNLQDDHEDRRYRRSKSMITRLKEKAKKWRQMLVKKRRARQGDSPRTPPLGTILDERDEEVSEHQGTMLSESDKVADVYNDTALVKDSTNQHPAPCDKPTATPLSNENKEEGMVKADEEHKHPAPELDRLGSVKDLTIAEVPTTDINTATNEKSMDQNPTCNSSSNNNNDNNKSLGSTVTEMLGPAYSMTQAIASKIQESSGPMYEIAAKQVWDKSASVREYLLQKLEPGEEDKALCKVITEVVSPRIVGCSSTELGDVNTKDAMLGEKEVSPVPISTSSHSTI